MSAFIIDWIQYMVDKTLDSQDVLQTETWMGHPKALFLLFAVEMWERFCYNGMRAIFVLYLIQDLVLGDNKAYAIYAALGSLLYATPFIGGIIADRVLGFKKAIILGCILLAAGEFFLVVPEQWAMYVGLGLMIVGTGFFKPNIASLLGKFYSRTDPRRDSAFTIFYMGVNLGGALAPIVVGTIGAVYGFRWGFFAAGIGVFIGLITFIKFSHLIGSHGDQPEKISKKGNVSSQELMVYAATLLSIPAFIWLISNDHLVGHLLNLFAAAVLVSLFYIAFTGTKEERDRMFVIMFFIFFTTLFWAFFEQLGSSITMFVERNMDRNVMGITIPTAFFQSLNPIYILIFAVPVANMWVWLAKKNREPSTPNKFAMGMSQLGLGFAVLWLGTMNADAQGFMSMFYIFIGILLFTTGELFLSPVGLSMVTRLSPVKAVGMVMGAWYLSTAFAYHIGRFISQATSVEQSAGDIAEVTALDTINLYQPVFGQIAIACVIAGALCFILAPVLIRRMHEDKIGDEERAAAQLKDAAQASQPA